MKKIVVGAAAALIGIAARKSGFQILVPWGRGIGTLGFRLGPKFYCDVYRSWGKFGVFWCRQDDDHQILWRGWLSQTGAWKIESGVGKASGRLGRLTTCRSESVAESAR